jgi:hypothetical protein
MSQKQPPSLPSLDYPKAAPIGKPEDVSWNMKEHHQIFGHREAFVSVDPGQIIKFLLRSSQSAFSAGATDFTDF